MSPGEKGSKMWGGRFDRPPNELFYEFQRSFGFDRRLLPYELAVDRAWTRELARLKILTAEETKRIHAALEQLAQRAMDDPAWVESSTAEDVHHFIEMHLIEELGALGAKLHTGRSRNELIATEFRMFIKDASREMREAVCVLIRALVDRAEQHLGVPMPGNTHMQHAQPILYSHYLLSHAEAFFHDQDRLAFAAGTADACPMGVAALAGCAFPVDRMALARELGFARITRNSVDTVSRRDFALDYLYALAVTAQHLSRLAEDYVLFASQEFGFVVLPDEFSTGSSLLPQKKNPDAWELIRGKAGRVVAALVSLLVTLKGLPTGYQRDLQEDKEPVFAAHEQMLAMTAMAAGAVAATKINEERLREAADDPTLLATEMADYLVERGLPFRQAHQVVGKICRDADRRGESLAAISLSRLKQYAPEFGEDVSEWLTLDSALRRRKLPGGTAPETVRAAIADCRKRLAALGSAAGEDKE